MNDFAYDLVVLGAGSGGLATAKRAASYGASVAIVEQGRVGGTCVIRGCVPKKLMVYAAEFAHLVNDATAYGWSFGSASHDWLRLVESRDRAVAALESTHERLLAASRVELVRGRGCLRGAHEVDVDGRVLTARYVLVATGGRPCLPPIEGAQHAMTSDGVFELRRRPDQLAIVGGGYIACEFAGIFAAMGSRVHLLMRGDLPLRGFDGDLRRELDSALRASGIDVRPRTVVREIRPSAAGVVLELDAADGRARLAADQCLLYAIGRRPNTEGLGLEQIGVELDSQGHVVCGEDAVTAVPNVFAVGDVTGRAALTPVAIQAGRLLADRIFGGKTAVMSYRNVPTAVFTDPPIGSVGLTEEEALDNYGADGIRVYKARFRPMLHSLTGRDSFTLVKLVVKGDDERVLGCHLIGKDAPEIIQGFAVAVKMGATKGDFDDTVGIHPSSAEELVTLR